MNPPAMPTPTPNTGNLLNDIDIADTQSVTTITGTLNIVDADKERREVYPILKSKIDKAKSFNELKSAIVAISRDFATGNPNNVNLSLLMNNKIKDMSDVIDYICLLDRVRVSGVIKAARILELLADKMEIAVKESFSQGADSRNIVFDGANDFGVRSKVIEILVKLKEDEAKVDLLLP